MYTSAFQFKDCKSGEMIPKIYKYCIKLCNLSNKFSKSLRNGKLATIKKKLTCNFIFQITQKADKVKGREREEQF